MSDLTDLFLVAPEPDPNDVRLGDPTTAPVSGVSTVVLVGVGVLLLAGFAPSVTVSNNQTALPGVGALTVSGFAPSVTVSNHQVVLPAVGALVVTGLAPAVVLGTVVYPDVGSLTLAGFAPTVTASDHRIAAPGVGALTLTGLAPAVVLGTVASPGTGALTLSGFAPTVTATQNVTVTPDVGALVLTGFAPDVQGDPVSNVPAGGVMQAIRRLKAGRVTVWTYEGYAPTVSVAPAQRFHAVPRARPAIVAAGAGALTLTGFAPSVVIGAVPVERESAMPAAWKGAGADTRERPFEVAGGRPSGMESVAPFISARDASSLRSPTAKPASPIGEDSATPAWSATPVVVVVGCGALTLTGYAPTISFGSAWSPASDTALDDDEDMLALALVAYDLYFT